MYVTVTVIFVFELHAWLCCILKKEKASEHKIVPYFFDSTQNYLCNNIYLLLFFKMMATTTVMMMIFCLILLTDLNLIEAVEMNHENFSSNIKSTTSNSELKFRKNIREKAKKSMFWHFRNYKRHFFLHFKNEEEKRSIFASKLQYIFPCFRSQ